ncbi:DUF4157 domain-containing protein [Haliscomenobacter sp.]|uniref:eCIS core domain-containing protein n=1 Tax=Haliscomenobacter sp. TaxID=2717303 RepID=UPI00359374BF
MAKQRQFRRKRRGPKGNTSRPAFFQNANPESSIEINNTTFFGPASGKVQPKLQVNQPGDVYEKQADAMAEQVVNSGPPTQSIATPAPKAAQRQGKEDIQKASQPEEVQKMAQPEEEKPIQKMDKPEEPQRKEQEEVQRKPEEEPAVQKKEEEVKRKPEEEKVQAQTSGNGGGTAPSGFAANLNHSKGQGSGLSKGTLNEMSTAFGQDFSGVRIHTDSQAEQLSEEISAQAFTHGNDIYFNQGKYNPESQDGKRLLAHELTHVVQQGAVAPTPTIQRQDVEEMSTPVPEDFAVTRNRRGRATRAAGTVGGVNVAINPDRRGRVPRGSSGVTNVRLRWTTPSASFSPTVSGIRGSVRISMSIGTTYRRGVDTQNPSGYGRGTTPGDQADGNVSLRFHEGSHGTLAMEFTRNNPLPQFTGAEGMTRAEYQAAITRFNQEMRDYNQRLQEAQVQEVDCVGSSASFCTP